MKNMGPAPVLGREQLVSAVAAARERGSRIILANGCFDLLHVGHIRYLAGAKALGGVLVVAINSDRTARALKGDGRPFTPEAERAELVAALRYVDLVTIFDEPTVSDLIRAIRPDFHAKGTDYTVDSVPERDIVRESGGRVVIVGDPKEHSSTDIVKNVEGADKTGPGDRGLGKA